MKTITISKIFAVAVLALSLITFQSCEKDTAPETQLITQSFGMKIDAKVTLMTKGWDKDTWVYNYSTAPATLTLTGTGTSAGQDYSTICTIQQLRAGTVSISMLPGTYNVTYVTPHTQSENAWSMNGELLASLNSNGRAVGDVLDIAINHSVTITGSPLVLTATLDDALIVVDIPTIASSYRFANALQSGSVARLLNDKPTFQYGYVNTASWMRLTFTTGADRTVDLSTMQKGNSYHIVSPIGASVNLITPDMTYNKIVLP